LYGKGFEVYGAQWVDHDILSFVGWKLLRHLYRTKV
jgi:hypothetical protein